MSLSQALSELVEWRTVTLALPAEIDRALELVAARRGWTKKETIAWALTGRAEVRREMAQDGGIERLQARERGNHARALKVNGGRSGNK